MKSPYFFDSLRVVVCLVCGLVSGHSFEREVVEKSRGEMIEFDLITERKFIFFFFESVYFKKESDSFDG